ncbi:hypothetical protein [Thalassobacillus sp. CUG 92003]|uniref:hypothetical protein n=1 Tax=Thalassobacillus sp. CUG 92003 TaxID=2736641 RepID=UPI0015E6C7FA|nr:hypothetical protein [Thalassobacillus sp. CUG 92003]
MKKALLFIWLLIILFIVAACNGKDDFARHHPELLPDDSNGYAIYVVEDRITPEMLEQEDIRITSIRNVELEEAKKYEQLNIEKTPAYVLFDQDGLVLKTYDYDELINHLKDD